MPSNHLFLCPLLLLHSIFLSFRVFSSKLDLCLRWPKYWSFSFSICPSNEYLGLISFRIDCFDLAVQGTLKSLFQHHSSKASILWHSAFFMVQHLHPSMTTGKTIALTRQTIVSKVMSLLNMLPRLVGCSFSSNKKGSFNFMAAINIYSDFGAQENKMSLFPLFSHLFAKKWWDWMPWSSFFGCWVLSQLKLHCPLSLSRGSSLPLHLLS